MQDEKLGWLFSREHELASRPFLMTLDYRKRTVQKFLLEIQNKCLKNRCFLADI